MEPLDTPAAYEALEAPARKATAPAPPPAAVVPKPPPPPPKQKRGRPTDPDSFLPRVFDSMSQCSAQMGIPVSFLKQAKNANCSAFRHGRVDIVEFLRWRFGQSDDASTDWGDDYNQWRAKREKLKFDEEAKRTIDRPAVQVALAKGTAVLFQKIDNEFGLMLPPVLKGLPEVEIQKRLLEAAETFKSTFRNELQALTIVDVDNQPSNQPAPSIQNENSPISAQ